jgi:hypothetical protein
MQLSPQVPHQCVATRSEHDKVTSLHCIHIFVTKLLLPSIFTGMYFMLQTFWDTLETRPSSSRGAAQVDALSGLQQLQVLDVDLFTLDRHARHLAGLTGLSTLQELEVEMVGDALPRSCNMQDGLPRMPYLTKLMMYTQVRCDGLCSRCRSR